MMEIVTTSFVLYVLLSKAKGQSSRSFFLRVQEQNALSLSLLKHMVWMQALPSGMNFSYLKLLGRHVKLSFYLLSFVYFIILTSLLIKGSFMIIIVLGTNFFNCMLRICSTLGISLMAAITLR